MPRLIPATGVVSYAGVVFPAALHTVIQAKVQYQTGEITRKYIDYSISVDTVLTYADPPMNNAVTTHADVGPNYAAYRKKLTSPGKTLTFTEQGFGDIVINGVAGAAVPAGARSMTDVAYGPKPRLLLWEPLSNRAVHVSWKCDTSAVECDNESTTGATGILEITHESSWNKDQEGRVTRTIRATIEIAANLVKQGNQLSDTADAYVDRFKPPTVSGFHREVSRQISRDHRILTITYIDTEIFSDNPFYPGMVHMSVKQGIASSLAIEGFTRWTNTLDGRVRYAAGVPVSVAWMSVADLIAQRFATGALIGAPVFNTSLASKKVIQASIPASFNLSNELFDREISFTFIWHSMVDLRNIIGTSTILRPITKVSWDNWHNSILPVQSPKGTLGLEEKVEDISVVDICRSSDASLPNNDIKKPTYRSGHAWLDFSCGSIAKEGSWMKPGSYTIQPVVNGTLVPIFTAIGPPDTAYTSAPPSNTAGSSGLTATTAQTSASSTTAPSYQSRTDPECRLIVTGEIERVCYPPYNPVFTHYGDVPLLLQIQKDRVTKVHGQFFPIYYMTVYREYILTHMPTGINPELITDANQGDR